jgi:hypothetical protein
MEGVDFYIVQCVEQLHVVQEDKGLDAYGFSVDKGDEVVIGFYYRKCRHKESSYELLSEEGHAIIYSNWVIVNKFAMTHATHKLKGGKPIYNLPHSSLERIKDVLVKAYPNNELEDQE